MKRLARNRPRSTRAPQEATWAVSYGDMITLLLGFYIMYFSIDPPKKNDETLTNSLITALEKMDDTVAVDRSQPKPIIVQKTTEPAVAASPRTAMQFIMDMIRPQDAEPTKAMALSARSLASASKASPPSALQAETEKISRDGAPTGSSTAEPKSALQAETEKISRDGAPTGSSTAEPKAAGYRLDVTEIRALDAEASRIGDRVYIMFPKVSFFASASTEMTPEGRQTLEKFAKVYLPFAGKALLNIVGFSDERPVKAVYRFRDNLELSVLRAVSAQRVAESVGIPLGRTRLMGHGINTRLADGEEPANALERWALTRKIMLVIEPEVQ